MPNLQPFGGEMATLKWFRMGDTVFTGTLKSTSESIEFIIIIIMVFNIQEYSMLYTSPPEWDGE